MKLKKLAQMSDSEILEALNSHNLCRIAFIDDEYPYISPFQYVYVSNRMFFHFTDYGKKKKILEKNTNVCVSIEKFETDLSNYYFVSIQGILRLVEDGQLKNDVMRKMAELARKNYSKTFLLAHGFEKEEDWKILLSEDQIIYTLEVVNKPIGLKSN